MTEKEIINDGALIGRNHTDFIAGEVSALPYEVRLPSGDWTPFLPVGERQYNVKGDSMSCVSFSANNCIEMQERFLTGQSQNYSDRWLAVMSGTTPQGNWLYKVADCIRHNGAIPEMDYPAPTEPWDWNKYHQPITDPLYTSLLKKGYSWLDKWSVSYEWVNVSVENFTKHLKHAPLQLVFPNHAIAGVALSINDGVVKYFDTYEPYIKTKHISEFSDAMKIVLTPKSMTKYFKVEDHGKLGVMILEGFTGVILFEDNFSEYLTQLKILGKITDQTPTIQIP